MTKYGLAHEKHDHSPLEYGCTYYITQPCRSQHQCCFFCGNFYKCQEGRCMNAFFSMKNQPHPLPFQCCKAKKIEELTWDLVFEHGTDTY